MRNGTPQRRRSRLATPLLAFGLAAALAACGSSGGTGASAAPSTTAAAATTTAATTTSAPAAVEEGATDRVPGTAATLDEAQAWLTEQAGLNGTQAGCVVSSLVGAVGEAKAIELVNDPRDLAELEQADAASVAEAMKGCIQPDDVPTLLAETFHAELKDAGVTKEHATCVAASLTEAITPDDLYELATGFGSFEAMDPAVQGVVFQAVIDCVPPEVLTDLAAQEAERAGVTTTAA